MRRGVLTAGTWCVDLNKSIPLWPAEDTMTYITEVERQGGGSGCNMAIDLKRLDPALPVETMGLIGDDGDGRFLLDECDRYGIGRSRLAVAPEGSTACADCFNSLESGRRTHFFAAGVAALLSPDHFSFSGVDARLLHLGLPGAHKLMDAPWGDDSTGWATVLRNARAAGLLTNLEMVSTDRDKVLRFGRSCLPHLDMLIVNDYEIGCVAEIETRANGRAAPDRIAAALRAALELGPLELAVAHFPEGAIAATREGGIVSVGSVAMPAGAIAGVNGAGDAFAAGVMYGRHEGWPLADSLAARTRLRGGVDAASFDYTGRGLRCRVPRFGEGLRLPPRSALRFRLIPCPHRIWFLRHGETEYNREGRLQGQKDIGLNPKGREQASAVGRALRKLAGPEMEALGQKPRLYRLAAIAHARDDGTGSRRDGARSAILCAVRRSQGAYLRRLGRADLARGGGVRSATRSAARRRQVELYAAQRRKLRRTGEPFDAVA